MSEISERFQLLWHHHKANFPTFLFIVRRITKQMRFSYFTAWCLYNATTVNIHEGTDALDHQGPAKSRQHVHVYVNTHTHTDQPSDSAHMHMFTHIYHHMARTLAKMPF